MLPCCGLLGAVRCWKVGRPEWLCRYAVVTSRPSVSVPMAALSTAGRGRLTAVHRVDHLVQWILPLLLCSLFSGSLCTRSQRSGHSSARHRGPLSTLVPSTSLIIADLLLRVHADPCFASSLIPDKVKTGALANVPPTEAVPPSPLSAPPGRGAVAAHIWVLPTHHVKSTIRLERPSPSKLTTENCPSHRRRK